MASHEKEAARLEKSLADLPEVAQAYEEHLRQRRAIYGDEYLAIMAYEAFNLVLWPYLERLLAAGGPEDELKRAFAFVEKVASSSKFARSVVATELGWELWGRRHKTPTADLNRVAERYMGPTTAAVFGTQEAMIKHYEETRWANRLRRWLRSRMAAIRRGNDR